MDQNETESAIDMFARDVVANAFDQGVQAATLALNSSDADLHTLNKQVHETPKKLSLRERQIAMAAAEGALAAFFSNYELVGGFSIDLIRDDGSKFDLSEQFGAPLLVAFDRDGWLATHSKTSNELIAMKKA
ncbi:hypothetical protein FEE96_10570 [Parasedimentitalea maritima]|uniref:Uncharacterized protein n=1 Tax=Parasedimentitalea maritima TaxID=2578117 RepID=A0ABY2V1T8_9RHOB|nr:hypothetical protein [Zongyanglinia marina]TLP65924.1 hypothetical protein FEE96_10570 [Zongyanglinia marina]